MSDSIVFKKIRNEDIFKEKFQNFKNKDNKIAFGNNDKNDVNIAVVYAPNGAGKTSLAKVLGTKEKSKTIELEVKYKKDTYTNENNNLFHIIKDQSNRNIIEGKDSYIKEVRKGKVIVLALSLGGIVTNLVAETEENIDVLVSLFYANDLSFTVFQTEAGKYIKKDFVENNFNRELLSKSWSIINPCLRKPIIDIDKILLVSGRFDKYVLNEDTDKLWENWGRPKRYSYASGHSGIVLCRSKINRDVLKFIDMRV